MERCLQAHRDRPGRGVFMDTTFNECTEALEPDFFAALRLTRSEDCAATGNAAARARSPAAVERAYKVHVQDLLPRLYVTDEQIIRTHPGAARARDAVLDADVAGDAEDARGEWVARGALLALLGVICAVVMRAAERRERRRRRSVGGEEGAHSGGGVAAAARRTHRD
jgi:hypothetical protein